MKPRYLNQIDMKGIILDRANGLSFEQLTKKYGKGKTSIHTIKKVCYHYMPPRR